MTKIIWRIIGSATKNGVSYHLLRGSSEGKPVFNVAKVGGGWPAGGYWTLESILALKGIKDFTVNSVLSLA